jgi:glucose-1-phosphate thymidylyltransferase/glucose-1-phosphate adenylyltransferase
MIALGSGGRPFLDYLLDNARAAGYREILLVVGERDDSIRAYYERAPAAGGSHPLLFARQPIPPGRTRPLGTADALLCGLQSRPDWSGGRFTVCNSDNLYSVDALRQMLTTPESNALVDYDRDSLGCEPERVRQFAVVEADRDGYLCGIHEKPDPPLITRIAGTDGRVGVSMNLFRFSFDMILPFLKRVPLHEVRQEKELPAAVMLMVNGNPHAVKVYRRSEPVPDLTSPDDIQLVQDFLRRQYPEAGPSSLP